MYAMCFNFTSRTNGLLASYCDKILQIRFKAVTPINEMINIRCAVSRNVSFIAQAVSRRPLIATSRVRAQVNPVGFVVDKVALVQVFLRVLRFSPVNIIPPWAPHFRKLKKKFFHSSIHSFTNNSPIKATAVQWDVSFTPIIRIQNTRIH
jgi:hypothetical protein